MTPVRDGLVMPLSVFVSQAVDSRVDFLRKPLSAQLPLFEEESMARQELVLLGGCTVQTAEIIPS